MTEGLRNHNGESASADALKDAGQRLLGSLVQRSAEVASQRVDGWTVRLSDITETGGDVRAALRKKSAADDADAFLRVGGPADVMAAEPDRGDLLAGAAQRPVPFTATVMPQNVIVIATSSDTMVSAML